MTFESLRQRTTIAGFAVTGMALIVALGFHAHSPVQPRDYDPAESDGPQARHKSPSAVDTSGHKRYGQASFYASTFNGRLMASGQRFSTAGNSAASRTLPLGTTARVTNLTTGKSAVIVIRDRGPYVGGRIVDLSPATAQSIGITTDKGIAPVEVAPIAVPLPDGTVKLGAAAKDTQVADNLLKTQRRPSEPSAGT